MKASNLRSGTDLVDFMTGQLAEWIPRVAAVVLVAAIGIVVAVFAGRGVSWLVRRSGLEALAEKVGGSRVLYAIGIKSGIGGVLGNAASIGVLLITGSIVAEMLGLPIVADAAQALTAFLPRIVVASVILAVGVFMADLARNVIASVGERGSGLESPDVVAKIAYWGIVTIAITATADQLGIQTDIVRSLIVAAIATTLGSMGLALALGSRKVVGNIVARHYVENLVDVGDVIAVDSVVGEIVRITGTSVVLDAADGTHVFPHSTLLDGNLVIRPVDPA